MKESKSGVVAVSGGFDPLHVGHVRMMQSAKQFGEYLVVILNNDNWLRKKKGYVFMPQDERKELIEALACVDRVVFSCHPKNPSDMSVAEDIRQLKPDVFVNGGDRTKEEANQAQVKACEEIGCEMIFGAGGGKIQSSSSLVNQARGALSTD